MVAHDHPVEVRAHPPVVNDHPTAAWWGLTSSGGGRGRSSRRRSSRRRALGRSLQRDRGASDDVNVALGELRRRDGALANAHQHRPRWPVRRVGGVGAGRCGCAGERGGACVAGCGAS